MAMIPIITSDAAPTARQTLHDQSLHKAKLAMKGVDQFLCHLGYIPKQEAQINMIKTSQGFESTSIEVTVYEHPVTKLTYLPSHALVVELAKIGIKA